MSFCSRQNQSSTGHQCRLVKRYQSSLPRLPPTSKFFIRLMWSFQKLIIVSDHHPYTRFHFRSQTASFLEKKQHGNSNIWWIVHPCSNFRLFWDNLMIMTLYFFFMGVPYLIAFFPFYDAKTNHCFQYIYLAHFICLFDILMSFVTGYISQGGFAIILSPRYIARHYTQQYFVLDVITSVPYSWFLYGDGTPLNSEVNFLAVIAEFVPLLKVFKISTLRYYIKESCSSCRLNDVAKVVIWYISLTILILHWSACITWSFPYLVVYATQRGINHSDAFILQNGVYKEKFGFTYLTSLHMGVTHLVGSSFTELKKTSMFDKLIRCIILMSGTGYTVYLIVVFFQLVETLAAYNLNYQEVNETIRYYIETTDSCIIIRNRLFEHYKYHFQGNYIKEDTIISILPFYVKEDIINFGCRDFYDKLFAAHNIPNYLLMNIVNIIEKVVYYRDDVIDGYGFAVNCMYFIRKGTAAVVRCGGMEIDHLKEGDSFGRNVFFYLSQKAMFIVAKETCEILLLHFTYFDRCVHSHIELKKIVLENFERRLDRQLIIRQNFFDKGLNYQQEMIVQKTLLKTQMPQCRQREYQL